VEETKNEVFTCQCGKTFLTKKNLSRHQKERCADGKPVEDEMTCKCGRKFDNINIHAHHKEYTCPCKFTEEEKL
jgi:hypothetical protein